MAQVYAGQDISNLANGFQIWPMIFQFGQYFFRPELTLREYIKRRNSGI